MTSSDNNMPGEVERDLTDRELALIAAAHASGFSAGYANCIGELPEDGGPAFRWFLHAQLSPLAALTQQESRNAE